MSIHQRSGSAPSSPPFQTQARIPPCKRRDSPLSTSRSSHNQLRGYETNRSLCLGSSHHMSPLKEGDGDERSNWLKGEEDEDVESAYTMSDEEPTVPPTPVESHESENPDRAIQRERVSSGSYASVSTSHSVFPHRSSLPPPSPGPLENRMAEYRDPCSSFLGRGQHHAQPRKPQSKQDHATEVPSSCCTWNRTPTRSRARAIPTAR